MPGNLSLDVIHFAFYFLAFGYFSIPINIIELLAGMNLSYLEIG